MRKPKSLQSIESLILHKLHNHKSLPHLLQIHAYFLRHRLETSSLVLAHFISVCASLNQPNYANQIFHQTQNPCILLHNALIKTHSLHPPHERAFVFYRNMKRRWIWPDEYTFAPLLKGCIRVDGFCRVGEIVHGEVLRSGFAGFKAVGIGLVEFYSGLGKMTDAVKVFDEMGDSKRDVIVSNLLVNGFCRVGEVDVGLRVFRGMSERSCSSWNTMVKGFARGGRDEEALGLCVEMRRDGVELDEVTVVTVLPVCAKLGKVGFGRSVHCYAELRGLVRGFVSVGNALVDFYCKCGVLEMGKLVFDGMLEKNAVSWNCMISGLGFGGKGEEGVMLFGEMVSSGVRPSDATFVGVLGCCVHAGLVEKGRELFASMCGSYQIEPKYEHFGCMVDLLGRSGHVREAYDMIKSMPLEPNAALWGSLLSACRNHGDMELAQLAVRELISLEPWNSGNYVLLSNVYAEEGKWDEVDKIRILMKENCVKKAPGQSSVGLVHS